MGLEVFNMYHLPQMRIILYQNVSITILYSMVFGYTVNVVPASFFFSFF